MEDIALEVRGDFYRGRESPSTAADAARRNRVLCCRFQLGAALLEAREPIALSARMPRPQLR